MSTQTEQIQAQKRAFYVRTGTGPENPNLISPAELQSLFDEIAWLRNRIKNNDGVVEPRFRPEVAYGPRTWERLKAEGQPEKTS